MMWRIVEVANYVRPNSRAFCKSISLLDLWDSSSALILVTRAVLKEDEAGDDGVAFRCLGSGRSHYTYRHCARL